MRQRISLPCVEDDCICAVILHFFFLQTYLPKFSLYDTIVKAVFCGFIV